jgi:hypothetical protein
MNPHCSVFVCTERGDIVKISCLLIFANKINFTSIQIRYR